MPSSSFMKKRAKQFPMDQEYLEDDARPEADNSLAEELVLNVRRLKIKKMAKMTELSDTISMIIWAFGHA